MTWLLAITTMSALPNKLQLQDPIPFESKCIRKTGYPRLFRHL